MNPEKLTPAQDAERPIPQQAIDELRKEWSRSAIGEMAYPQWCEQQAIYARRLVALIVNSLSLTMNSGKETDDLMELMQAAATSALMWMPVLGAASQTLGRESTP